jgi:hypothetical protein
MWRRILQRDKSKGVVGKMWRWILLLSLVSCVRPGMTEHAARSGYFMANYCVPEVGLPYDQIKRIVVKGPYFTVVNREGTFNGIIGYADWENKRILVAETHKNNPVTWGHEWLHVLTKIGSHPDSLFGRCNLR